MLGVDQRLPQHVQPDALEGVAPVDLEALVVGGRLRLGGGLGRGLRGGVEQGVHLLALLDVPLLHALQHVGGVQGQQAHPAGGQLESVLPQRLGGLDGAEVGVEPQGLNPLLVLLVLLGPADRRP